MSERWKLQSEEIRNLNSSPNIARVLKSRSLKWAGNVVRFKDITLARTVLSENLKDAILWDIRIFPER